MAGQAVPRGPAAAADGRLEPGRLPAPDVPAGDGGARRASTAATPRCSASTGTAVSYYPDLEGGLQHARRGCGRRPATGSAPRRPSRSSTRPTAVRDAPDHGHPDHERHAVAPRPPGRDPGGRAGGGGAADLHLGQPLRAASTCPTAARRPSARRVTALANGVPCGATVVDRARPLRAAGLLRRR